MLLTTYNRSALLKSAIASILKQDFQDFELVIHDDASTDDTEEVVRSIDDKRIVYIRAETNIGQKYGDTPIVGKCLREHCRSHLVVHINDDDEWISETLLSRQAAAFNEHPSLATVIGGVVQKYPHPIEEFPAPDNYLENVFLEKDSVFVRGVFPNGFIPSREFLSLFADDPPNRNIVCGAMLFDVRKVPLWRYFGPDFGAQAGPAMLCGAAMHGDVFYMDSPELINRVEKNCLSFKGTQADHFSQCLASVNAAFSFVPRDEELRIIRARMIKSYFRAYLCNKIAWRMGWFGNNPLGDLNDIMVPPISASEFSDALKKYGIELTDGNKVAIALSDKSVAEITRYPLSEIQRMCA